MVDVTRAIDVLAEGDRTAPGRRAGKKARPRERVVGPGDLPDSGRAAARARPGANEVQSHRGEDEHEAEGQGREERVSPGALAPSDRTRRALRSRCLVRACHIP